MINRETKLFRDIAIDDHFVWGGHVCRKVSAARYVIELSHRWEPGQGRIVHRDYAGTKLAYNPKHYVYGSDVHVFTPYVRNRNGVAA